jgi:hypothetical protein
MHCRRGADRTGLVSTLVVLLLTDTSLPEALHQLGPRFGHFALGKPRFCDYFFELYDEWLQQQGLQHTRSVFRHWLLEGYCPGGCRCQLTKLEIPKRIPSGQPAALRVRVQNTSVKPWRLSPGNNAGIHAGYILADEQGRCVVSGRAGLIDAVVAPGQSIDLTLPLPALHKLGNYALMVDMIDEQQCWFYQAGSEPLQDGLSVCDPNRLDLEAEE